MYDVIVIGAGPCGSVAAKETACHNLKTLLIDKKKHIGRPVHCTGLLSKKTVETLKISQNSLLNEIKGAYIHFPNGKRITIATEEIKAYVVDREALDKELLSEAKKIGVDVKLETEAVNISQNTIEVEHKSKKSQLKADVFIGAYGSRYSSNNTLTAFPPPKKILYGLQTIARYTPIGRNFVELFFGSTYSDCFFAWAVPMNEKDSRVGLACSKAVLAKQGFQNLLERLKCNCHENPIAGIIPIGPPKITAKGNMLICGDAAGQAKPTSGGGIYTGTLCAKIAAQTTVRYLNGKGILTEYEKNWRKEIGKEFKIGMFAHEILTRLTDTQMDRMLPVFANTNNLNLIKEVGNIDYPSLLIRKFFSSSANYNTNSSDERK